MTLKSFLSFSKERQLQSRVAITDPVGNRYNHSMQRFILYVEDITDRFIIIDYKDNGRQNVSQYLSTGSMKII